MLKAKTSKDAHKSRTLSEAIDDVRKTEMAQINVPIPKDIRKKFKRAAEDNGADMANVLRDYIYRYIDL